MILQMEKDRNAAQEGSEAPANQSTLDASFPDTKAQFEIWLRTLKPDQQAEDPGSQFSGVEEQAADFFVECDEGTDCQIVFSGVLSIGGYLAGSLTTDDGTLITRARGRISGDIHVVGMAFIDSVVHGNINATGRVVLNGNARVVGNISAPALSIKPGAIVEGDFLFQESLGSEVGATSSEAVEEVGFLSVCAMGD